MVPLKLCVGMAFLRTWATRYAAAAAAEAAAETAVAPSSAAAFSMHLAPDETLTAAAWTAHLEQTYELLDVLPGGKSGIVLRMLCRPWITARIRSFSSR